MITSFFLNLLTSLLSFVSTTVPAVNLTPLTDAVSTGETDIFSALSFLNPVVDVNVVFIIINVGMAVLLASLVFKLINFVISKLPLMAAFG